MNSLAEMIENHFGDGSLSLVRDPIIAPMSGMNGDVLTCMAFGGLIDFHEDRGAKATLCLREHQFRAPNGVAEVDGVRMKAPTRTPDLPLAGQCDMPELHAGPALDGEMVGACPLHDGWLDIRRPRDFESAEAQFSAMFAASWPEGGAALALPARRRMFRAGASLFSGHNQSRAGLLAPNVIWLDGRESSIDRDERVLRNPALPDHWRAPHA